MPDTNSHYTDREFPRPRVVLSKCLELEPVRYNGQRIPDQFVRQLMDWVELVPVCPEVGIGLGVPRDTIRMVDRDGETRLMQPSTEEDLTEQMRKFTADFLDSLGPVDGFVLKNGSPTCGTSNVKVYGAMENAPGVRKEPGMFAAEVLEEFGHLAVEDEGRLRNYPIRHHFLTQLFAFTELRELGDSPTMAKLVDFQRRYKHLLYLYDEPRQRTLGRVVANHEGLAVDEVWERYAEVFREALSDSPSRKAHINALTHMYGHFKDKLPQAERKEFLRMLDEFRNHHLTLNAPISIIRSWCARHEYDYLADQAYLEPYPRELVQMRDSGKGLDF